MQERVGRDKQQGRESVRRRGVGRLLERRPCRQRRTRSARESSVRLWRRRVGRTELQDRCVGRSVASHRIASARFRYQTAEQVWCISISWRKVFSEPMSLLYLIDSLYPVQTPRRRRFRKAWRRGWTRVVQRSQRRASRAVPSQLRGTGHVVRFSRRLPVSPGGGGFLLPCAQRGAEMSRNRFHPHVLRVLVCVRDCAQSWKPSVDYWCLKRRPCDAAYALWPKSHVG